MKSCSFKFMFFRDIGLKEKKFQNFMFLYLHRHTLLGNAVIVTCNNPFLQSNFP